MLSEIYSPGIFFQAVIAADSTGRFNFLNEDLVRASHNVPKDINTQHEGDLDFDGISCQTNFSSSGEAPTHDKPDGLVDYGVTAYMTLNEHTAYISERVNLTFESNNNDPQVLVNTRLVLQIPGIIPETAADELIGQPLHRLLECRGPFASIANQVIKHLEVKRGGVFLKVSLDTGNWEHTLREAHLKWERHRPAVRQARKELGLVDA